MAQATAPGKIILFGEHAVVYGRPAIAAPVTQVRATAIVEAGTGPGIRLVAPDLAYDEILTDTAVDDPLAAIIAQFKAAAQLEQLPDLTITVHSQIPIASGLGSGAAITAATIRALARYLALPHLLSNERVSALTYEVEKIYHGTPSGIDNTVVSYEQPVYFVRRQPQNQIDTFAVARPVHLLVADTGVRSHTKVVVGDVRRQWEAAPDKFEALFDECGRIAQAARRAIEQGNMAQIGRLMNENHAILQKMTVSSPELDALVTVALQAGATGAKMSGAGRGGNMIALVNAQTETAVRHALFAAGAHAVLTSIIAPQK